jgi:beta-glucosidase-like glycosyl hydrolase
MKSTRNALEKKIYQLIISRLDGDCIGDAGYEERIKELVRRGIGGFIVFGGLRETVRNFLRTLRAISDMPLFLAADVERGVGQQIQGATRFPCQMAVAAAIDLRNPEETRILERVVTAIAVELKDVGINMPLIPVLDVNQNPDNPIICTRAFSDNPETVALFGSYFIKTFERDSLLSCAKHFPGHGDTAKDSHIELPVINKSRNELMAVDIVPFKEAIRSDVSSVMIGHLTVPVFDDRPASLSKPIITTLLRKELGFEGLVMTDALNMHALIGFGNIPVQCINAGADILLHPSDTEHTVEEVLHAVETGDISEARIDTAVSRILGKKNIQEHTAPHVDYNSHEILASQIAEMSITLVKDAPGVLPLSDRDRVSILLCGDASFFPASPLQDICRRITTLPQAAGMQEHFQDAVIVFAVFTSVAAWKGSSGIPEDEIALIKLLARRAKHSLVLSFGSPYVLRYFKEADMLIAAYEGTEQAQHAVVKCLEGQSGFSGRLPVKFSFFQ